MPKPVLLLACGNPSRGDDALGPLLLEFVEAHCDSSEIELLTDFQLQIEHALDLENRELVLFVDASVSCADPFELTELEPALDSSYTTHAMSPAAVMAVYRSIKKQPLPPCFLLGIKGESFELGEGVSGNAGKNLQQACRFVEGLLDNPDLAVWRQLLPGRTGHVAPSAGFQGCIGISAS
ncbi:hydrogenase maturation protease [Methylomicrobium sp. Wu6]|uniref:hydrogenase maturation protease n=1 Tax=Methylomicrobium sp. Wu6 TaxID=3107928 RepID=UPI002DD6404F|nr:hydrogenase maturation protease [Methylomicrobium sp. Wu6]MEC4750326.1 hydrogenase maturation protease [Methylomicrobium sp. Wu6]